MYIKSYSKVNYTLEVGAKREDGFHSLKSIVQTIDLCDTIHLDIANRNIDLSCSDNSIPCDSRNTIYKMARLFLDEFKIDKGLYIYLEKNIPSQAGLGGGSANASYLLLKLNEIFETNLNLTTMSYLSAQIGSDCPLFIYGGTVLMEGRGEFVTPIESFPKVYLLIIKPNWAVSTKEAYSILDARENILFNDYSQKLIDLNNTNQLNFNNLCKYLYNDFELINKDEIDILKTDLINAGAKASLLSGSGSCVFGLFENTIDRDKAFDKLKSKYNLYKAESKTRTISF